MSYEKFRKQRRPVKDQPIISILKGGQLGFNKVSVEKHLKKFKYVFLLYDADEKKIGIQPTNEGTQDAHNIRFLKNGALASISARQFLKHFKIEHEVSLAYPAVWNEKEKLIEIVLK